MTGTSLYIRPAQPTRDDGLAFARYLDMAADGVFRFMLGGGSDHVLASAFVAPGHDLSHEHVSFAELDRGVVGMTSDYSAGQHHDSSDRPLIRAAGWRIVRMGIVSLMAAGPFRFIDAVPHGDYYLQAIAVNANVRDRGIGSTLFDRVELRARAVGSERLALDVAVDNRDARRLYERSGFAIEATSPRSYLGPESQVHRMVKPL